MSSVIKKPSHFIKCMLCLCDEHQISCMDIFCWIYYGCRLVKLKGVYPLKLSWNMPTLLKVDIFILSIKAFIGVIFSSIFYYSLAPTFPPWRFYMLLFIVTQNTKFSWKFKFSYTKGAKKKLSNQIHCR